MRSTFLASFIGATLILTGCRPVHIEVTRLSQTPAPVNHPVREIVVLSQMPTDRKYQEISLINAKSVLPLNDMLPEIRRKASELGADAIVIKTYTLPEHKESAQVLVVAIRFL